MLTADTYVRFISSYSSSRWGLGVVDAAASPLETIDDVEPRIHRVIQVNKILHRPNITGNNSNATITINWCLRCTTDASINQLSKCNFVDAIFAEAQLQIQN